MPAMGQSLCSENDGLKKEPWTPQEDQTLLAYIAQHGHGCWRSLPAKAGLQRCGKSCRLRWTNYLRPDINFSLLEEQTIIRLHALLVNRLSAIATHLPNRSDNEIKNYWNTHLKKRLSRMGINPVTHKPRSGSDALGTGGAGGGAGGGAVGTQAHLSHTAQWESARLEAQALMARAREASRQSALAASASVSARRRRCPDTLPTERATHASVLEQFLANVAASRAAMPEPVEVREDHHVQRQKWGDHFIDGADADLVAGEFAGMLLDESLHQQQTENEKKYWINIMHLVNSPSASASQTSVAMPTPLEASSSSAPLQTSISMPPAPEASSSSASFSTSSRCAHP